MDPDFIFVQKAGTCFLYVYFQGTGFLGVSIFMGTVYSDLKHDLDFCKPA